MAAANSLASRLGPLWTKNCYYRIFEKVTVERAEAGHLLGRIQVDEDDVNMFSTLHGGYSASLVEAASLGALFTLMPPKPVFTTELATSFIRSANIGDTVVLRSSCVRRGRMIAFLEARLEKENGDVIVTGKQTVLIGEEPTVAAI